jgi:hypothetical protein
MLKRLLNSGINIAVLGISVVLFLVALFGLLSIGNAQKPETIDILAAAQALNIGDTIDQGDLIIKTVFQDENTSLYIPADESDSLPGSLAVLPIHAGQPIMRDSIISPAAEGTRLSAALASYPSGNSLFPFPLDAANVISPDITAFLPGDKIEITVVIGRRPQEIETATPEPDFTLPDSLFEAPEVIATIIPPSEEEVAVEKAQQELEERAFPPLAKDLFPQGALVISIQGLPPEVVDAGNLESATGTGTNTSYNSFSQPERLMLLIPDESREELALSLQQGNLLIISLIKEGQDGPSTEFTYWDFEDLFKLEHNQAGE